MTFVDQTVNFKLMESPFVQDLLANHLQKLQD